MSPQTRLCKRVAHARDVRPTLAGAFSQGDVWNGFAFALYLYAGAALWSSRLCTRRRSLRTCDCSQHRCSRILDANWLVRVEMHGHKRSDPSSQKVVSKHSLTHARASASPGHTTNSQRTRRTGDTVSSPLRYVDVAVYMPSRTLHVSRRRQPHACGGVCLDEHYGSVVRSPNWKCNR
ncbi:hypothetical protein BDW22DRAFT_702964 [Trametopsis cervina]|nr:hypothetical protein BDW22DRAFT_702964 [Trametopsis cervina]